MTRIEAKRLVMCLLASSCLLPPACFLQVQCIVNFLIVRSQQFGLFQFWSQRAYSFGCVSKRTFSVLVTNFLFFWLRCQTNFLGCLVTACLPLWLRCQTDSLGVALPNGLNCQAELQSWIAELRHWSFLFLQSVLLLKARQRKFRSVKGLQLAVGVWQCDKKINTCRRRSFCLFFCLFLFFVHLWRLPFLPFFRLFCLFFAFFSPFFASSCCFLCDLFASFFSRTFQF